MHGHAIHAGQHAIRPPRRAPDAPSRLTRCTLRRPRSQNPYEAKRLQQLLEERPAAPSLASVSEDAVVPDELSSRLRKKTAEVESVLKSIELEPTSLSELLTLQANLRTAKKTTGLDPTRLAAGEQRLTSSAARLMEEEAAKSAPDQDVLADLLAIAKEVGVAAAAMAAAQKVLQRVDAQQTLKSVRMGGLKRGNSSRYDLEAAVKDAEDAGVSKAEVKAGKAALTELKKEMSTMDLKEAKFEREEEIKEAYEKLINDREGLITAEVLADLEALQRAAKRMGSVLNKQKQKQLDTALKGAQDYVKRLGRLCDEADADLIGLDHGLALQLITESREDHDLDEARLLEKKLGRRTALTAHGEELDAAVAKWEAAAASRQAEAVARAHSELSDLLEKVKGEGFERSQSKALAKADDIIREYIEACAAAGPRARAALSVRVVRVPACRVAERGRCLLAACQVRASRRAGQEGGRRRGLAKGPEEGARPCAEDAPAARAHDARAQDLQQDGGPAEGHPCGYEGRSDARGGHQGLDRSVRARAHAHAASPRARACPPPRVPWLTRRPRARVARRRARLP